MRTAPDVTARSPTMACPSNSQPRPDVGATQNYALHVRLNPLAVASREAHNAPLFEAQRCAVTISPEQDRRAHPPDLADPHPALIPRQLVS